MNETRSSFSKKSRKIKVGKGKKKKKNFSRKFVPFILLIYRKKS